MFLLLALKSAYLYLLGPSIIAMVVLILYMIYGKQCFIKPTFIQDIFKYI